ncbi:head GIN domain-containing protein [Flavobacterium restrictum]|uniref:DUF2807 domain-containing protein n=1 Tax=Flavobacterium restrictum TaxID=2594428 RepID=A0A553E2A8_9FLAO|nr:head GIN domain-containing protein [Flavobacterium restrictum]TRX39169.1 DUF2807 domain-containing protein [Flavobacterium restrictum]
MIKIITIITQIIVATLTALLFASCNQIIERNAITGSGKVTTQKRIVQGDFNKIDVSNTIEVIIEQSDKVAITVEADDNLQNGITTTVENGTLVIKCQYNSFVNVSEKKVHIKMPLIEGLTASSASSIKSNAVIVSNKMRLTASSAATIDVAIESDVINCDLSSASAIAVKGKALQMDVTSSSGSSFNAKELLVNDITANASSGSVQNIHPIVSLNAEASSGGTISYNTNPKISKNAQSSGGSINKE